MFEIETANAIYQINFCHLQVNITSRCNMKCQHCRGDYEGRTDLSLNDFNAIMDFAGPHMQNGAPFLISGGEPLLHPNFKEIMKILKARNVELASITTNGTFLTREILDYLDKLKFKDLRISVSLDSLDEKEHNDFRNNRNAYHDAIRAIKLISKHPRIRCIVRTTIKKSQIAQVPDIIKFVYAVGADIFSISSVLPAGRARTNKNLWFDAKSKKKLLEIIKEMKMKYPSLIMDVNDPLRCLLKIQNNHSEGFFGGCIAGIGSFSVEPNGTLLPCPLLHNQPIANIKNKTGKDILNSYVKSKIIHNLIDRNLKGKCGSCENKNICGGCRVRAEAATGDYLGTDPECFYNS